MITRRRFLQAAGAVGLATGASAGLPRVALGLPHGEQNRDALVLVFLRGGMDGLSALVPLDERTYYDRRPGIAVPARQVLNLDGRFGLHPALAPLHEIFQEGDLALVPAVGHPALARSHFMAMDRVEAGMPEGIPSPTGFLARHLASRGAISGGVPAVALGPSLPRSLRGSESALAIRDVSDFSLGSARGWDSAPFENLLLEIYEARQGTAGVLATEMRASLAAVQRIAGAEAGSHAVRHGAVYPVDRFGRGLRQIAQLLRTGGALQVEVATIDMWGWDTHRDMGEPRSGRMADLLGRLAAGLHAIYLDLLDLRGEVTLVVLAEFGRQVHENGSGGTDHGNGGLLLAMGGGIRGGVHGTWPGLEGDALVRGDGVAPVNDFRDVLAEILSSRLGNPRADAVFPGLRHQPLGLTVPRDGLEAAFAEHD